MAFDETDIMKGFVRVITPVVEPNIGKMHYKDMDGNWVKGDTPSVYISHPDTLAPDYPRVLITFNGDRNLSAADWDFGVAEVDDPENEGELICVPYKQVYLKYILTLTANSGMNNDVLTGSTTSASTILRSIRDRLQFESFRDTLHTEMLSTVNNVSQITPTYNLRETSYHNAATMSLTFDYIDTLYDYSGGWFNAVQLSSQLYRNEDDDSPLTSVRTVGPVD